jgi:VIT1/CCC1 family predicted Fe2+/Mn2+ transporter
MATNSASSTSAAMPANDERDSQSTLGLIRRLTNELATLVRQEIALATAEVSRSMSTLLAGAASVATGGAVLFAGLLVLLASAVLGLSNVLAPWLAALIVGLAVGIVGYIMVHAGLKALKPAALKPERTQESLLQDKDVLMRKES